MKLHHLVATMLLVGSLALVGKAIAALGAPSPNAPPVMVVMMENKNYSEVIGQTNQPYTNQLAVSNGLATQSYATTTGLPNYLAIVCGSTLGVGDVLPSQQAFPNTATVADQLSAAGYPAKAYAEDLPPDPTNTSGNYNVQHF